MEKQLLDSSEPRASFLANLFKCLLFASNRRHSWCDDLDILNYLGENEDPAAFSDSDVEGSDDEDAPLPQYNQPVTESRLSGSVKLYELRKLMKKHNIAVYLIPSEDEHQSEYTAQADKRREYLCGFTGSAGICVVTLDDFNTLAGEAALSTDGRYFLQAEKVLDAKLWRLLKQGVAGSPSWQEYAFQKAAENRFSNVISCDPKLLSLKTGQSIASAQTIRSFQFVPLGSENLVDVVWGLERPRRSTDAVYELPLDFSGETTENKLARVRQFLKIRNASHLLVTALDDIGWLLNLRADSDIPFSPFFFAYVIVTTDSVVLYADPRKLKNVKNYLDSILGLLAKPYDHFYLDLASLKTTTDNADIKLILPSKDACNYALLDSLPRSVSRETIEYDSVISVMKLTKNKTELFNARMAQAKDSLLFIILASWLESKLLYQKKRVTEYQVAQKIYQIRARFPNFKGLSYETIASTGPNAAIIHYAPSKKGSSVLDIKTPFLLDSGAQYLEGTTDITRTYKFGDSGPMDQYRRFYTLVLKGHLNVALAKFPGGTGFTGTFLDAYAHQPLWNEGLDFSHGTGHGVGSFGNVHESPLYFSRPAGGVSLHDYFVKGAILTDEPGYYVDGKYGFRIESELEVIECPSSFGKTSGGQRYLGFEYLTLVPFCINLIEKTYLTISEKKWINKYHSSIRAKLGPKLLTMGEKKAYRWLLKETRLL